MDDTKLLPTRPIESQFNAPIMTIIDAIKQKGWSAKACLGVIVYFIHEIIIFYVQKLQWPNYSGLITKDRIQLLCNVHNFADEIG